MPETLVLIHGYSDQGKSFARWKELLQDRYADVEQINVCNYQTLTNEITIKDIAEGFDRALKLRPGLSNGETFDAVVHSTGMLVIRAWLTTYPHRRDRLKRIIALAPATFGSPLAAKGRSWLGSVFKGNKHLGPDFLEAGDLVLDGLELASSYTWELAEKDIFGSQVYYGTDEATPYVFVFCGTESYSGLRKFVSFPGGDGTVRQSGCGLNVRRIRLDLTKENVVLNPQGTGPHRRIEVEQWRNANIPVHLIGGINHGTILTDPTDELVALVRSALDVSSPEQFAAWLKSAGAEERKKAMPQQWQQFIVRAMDERGDAISDYNLQLFSSGGDDTERIEAFDEDVAVYSGDASYRCFHVDLNEIPDSGPLSVRIIASSGSEYVGYEGFAPEADGAEHLPVTSQRTWDAQLELAEYLQPDDPNGLNLPFTTTLIEIHLDREPLPFDFSKLSDLVGWWGP